MHDLSINVGLSAVFAIVGAVVGIALVLLGAVILPKMIEHLTPELDEAKEIARGNTAVAEYFGRVVAAGLIGLSIVVAAAVLGGIIAALH